jgi:hypothetical protein
MPRSSDTGRRNLFAFTLLATVLAVVEGAHAQQTSRWTADDVLPRAVLPIATGSPIAAAALSCEAKRWTLSITPTSKIAGNGQAVITVDNQSFEAPVAPSDAAFLLRIPQEAVQPLSKGLRMSVTFSGAMAETMGALVFPLRGSKLAIDAIEERCSQRDMSAFQPLTFTPYSSYLGLATELRADDITAFSASTASQPQLSVAMAEMGEGQRVLFTRLCGSSWYYGVSRCNITGFVATSRPVAEGSDGSEEWRTVYDTEGVELFLDMKSRGNGWPALVTLPVRGRGSALVWRWDGKRYARTGILAQDEDARDNLPLRPSHD